MAKGGGLCHPCVRDHRRDLGTPPASSECARVILGYYFGRLPAERVAARAEEKAEEAIKTKQQELSDSAVRVNGQQEKYRKLMEQIDGLITSLP